MTIAEPSPKDAVIALMEGAVPERLYRRPETGVPNGARN